MAPLVESFPASHLQAKIQYHPDGKPRKPPIELENCARKELQQFFCELDGPKEDPRSKVICEGFLRTFRRCANGLTVETTSWEGENGSGEREG